ncbi:MAG: hypothetical protein Q8P17_03570 [bacterium]|nr:hypothetical protein [bacterium]
MNAITQTTATAGQVKQINRFGSDAIEKVLAELGLDNPGAQRVIEHGDDFAEAIRTAAITSLKDLSVSDKYKDEEVQSSYAYPKGYKVKGITEQTNILRQLFPGIGFADEKIAEQPLPPNAEGWFAIPKWQTLAPTYGEAVEKVLAMIASKRKFYNYRDGQLGAEYLRQHAKTVKMFQQLGDEQKDFDILVVPAQFGLRHKGRSVRRAREVFAANEFGLGAFAIGIMLLTHPEREVQWEQLHVDCAGDESAPEAVGDFAHAPLFYFNDGRVGFSAYWFDGAGGDYGSSSAFLPQ